MNAYRQDMEEHIQKTIEHLDRELSTIRTGRANPTLIEDLAVECYGTTTPLQQLASISAPEPRVLLVQPWDGSITDDITKAINQSSLGINPVVDGKNIRLPFPPMTEERRLELVKVVEAKGEEAKVSIRQSREGVMKQIKTDSRDNALSEDEAKIGEKDIQVAIDASHKSVAERLARKIEEITTI